MTATIAKRQFRQLAVTGLGRDQPTLLLTNQRDLTAKQLIERYAKRWIIENQLAAQIRAFHLDALTRPGPPRRRSRHHPQRALRQHLPHVRPPPSQRL